MQHKFKKADSDDYEEILQGFEVAYIPHKSGTYYIEINKAIRHVSQFSDAIQVLEIAGPEDEVVIKLSTPGGSIDATDAFIHALRKCNAPVHMIATGGVHSAGSAILLEAESFELSENFSSLLHCGGCGTVGNTNEVIAQAAFLTHFMPTFMRNTYEGFLTPEEIEKLIEGKDIWLTAEQWVARYEARNAYIIGKIEELKNPKPTVKKPRKKAVKTIKAVDTAE
ncbi:MAG: ATP-dependent Clp protease proteolytic subunit [Halobacteriota archaeon]